MAKKNEITIVNNSAADFQEIVAIIQNARIRAYSAVNRELITMYWQIGQYVSEKVKSGVWGKSVVNDISRHIKNVVPNLSGFSPQNLWRMKQYFETYKDNEILSTLSRELSWSINTRIMGADTAEEREFYLRLSAKNKYSYRELDRQMDSALYQRHMLSKGLSINKLLTDKHDGLSALRDSYVLEFLDMPTEYKEKDLRKAIVANLKNFILEIGKEFAFIGQEYKVQVGNSDFFIDLVFYNRELACLVAIELKLGKFKPDHVGQILLYLEALDRDVKKQNENPSVGLILCTSKDDAVVEYTMSKTLTPSLVAQYKLALPDKKLLESKLKEIVELTQESKEDDVKISED